MLSELPEVTPPAIIAEVAAIVGKVDGVRFAELIAALPGDAQGALDAVLDAALRPSPEAGAS